MSHILFPMETFLTDLRSRGIQLWADGDNLRCSAPKNSMTPTMRQHLADHKQEILNHLQQEASASGITLVSTRKGSTLIPVVARHPDQGLPLSFAQQRLWFLDQLEKSATWNIPAALQIRGPLNPTAMTHALTDIVRRHETLRTTFNKTDHHAGSPVVHDHAGSPIQIIHPPTPITLPCIDLRRLTPKEQQAEIRRWITHGEEYLFDLSTGPLLWVTLLQLANDSHLLLLTLHHIIADGWSVGVLIREIGTLYAQHVAPQPLITETLPELPIQYADFACWQRTWLQGGELDRQLAYWQKQLAGAPALLELPTDRPRPPVQTFRGSVERFTFGPDLTLSLRTLSRQTNTTLFMTLLTGFAVLLSRYSGQEDLIVGSPVANRNRSELETLIGFFVNTLVLRMDCSQHPTFRALLQQVQKTTLDAYAHQDVPFEHLVERLKPTRTRSHSPLFQVMFILQNTPEASLELPDLSITLLDQERVPAKYDLLLAMEERQDKLLGEFEYNTDLFDATTIRRMIGHLETLLTAATQNPDQVCAKLPLLPQAEYHQMVHGWNQTTLPMPPDACIHTLVEAMAAKTPDAPALDFEHTTLSYRMLNEQANQLAHHLMASGVQPGTLVGISLERSLETVIGLLAILKAGGAYVPMDPNHPKERLGLMIEDAQLSFMVVQSALMAHLPPHQARMIVLDRDEAVIRQHPTTNPNTQVTPQHPAYVIYTSGSTGRPKGVVVLHGRLTRMFLVTRNWFHFDEQDVWSLFHAFSFDFSVWEMWGALLFGGRLVVVSRATSRSPEAFYDLLHTKQITVLNLNPSVFQALTSLEESGHVKQLSLRLVIFGAEPLKVQNLRPWFDRHGDQTPQLINLYGITESTVHTTYHALSRADLQETNLKIGPPRAELHPLYILDDHLQPVPIGVPGQLYVGGGCLAIGYLDQPELTAKAFLPDPFCDYPESRLQKTGDLARFLPDGNIAFLGRKDYQVKVRGFRIELGEIEAVLVQHPDVYEAAVTTWEEHPGEKQLVAFVEAPGTQPASQPEQLRAFLKRKLPDYMIPTRFVVMETLPRSPNGKVDRRQLPPPHEWHVNRPSTHVPPRNHTEEMVAAAWSTLLNRPQVGRTDNFFDLGGHSLMATRVMARLRDIFALDLPLTLLFDTPTVAGMSEQIDAARRQSNRMPAPPPIGVTDRSKPLALSFAQQRLWFLEQLEGGLATYNMPGGITLTGKLDPDALEKAIQTIIRRHEALRTVFPSVEGHPIQQINPATDVPITRMDLGVQEALLVTSMTPMDQESQLAARVQQLALEEMQKPFDLTQDPLLRATLIRLGDESHVLLFTFHHSAADGWSIALFIGELAQLYNAFLQGQPSPLPELPIQYADYSQWQRQWLKGAVMETQLDYWKKQLAEPPVLLELPTDRLRPPVQTFHGNDIYFQMDATTSQKVSELSRTRGTTLFMTLLAAFVTLLGRLSDQDDLIVGTPVANRGRPETESLIGFFVNTLALRVDLSGDPPFLELLSRVRRMTLDAFAHQDLPFEQLVEEIHPARNLSHSPLFQVMFAWQDAPSSPVELTGLTLTPMELIGKSAKFDLTLSMEEGQEGLIGGMEYNTDLFDASTIERMIGHFKHLLTQITANPDLPISRLPILTQAERQQVLQTWNDTKRVYPGSDRCIHQLFEAKVEQTPNAVALVCDDGRTLDFAGLNRRANQLAHHLRTLGVGPETLVGVCMERNLDLVVGLLAILKAGGAYVPLDPNYPAERLAFMLEDMQNSQQTGPAPVVLTQEAMRERLPPTTQARVICLDGLDATPIASQSVENPHSLSHSNHLAYVIYTSGSTGLPKGVAIEHRNTVALILWTQEFFTRSWFDQVLASTSICFDLSVFELFVPLSWGGTVILVKDALELPTAVAAGHRITLINTVPSAMAALLRLGALPDSVRLIILAGEPFKDTLAHAIYENASILHFYNLYGPSEDTTYSTYARIPENLQGSPSIGRPIANTRAYVLDRHLEPVPVGVAGELHLSGDGVARGYLNRPELSAEKFILDPFQPEADNPIRMYKTGDLARFRPDGTLDFLGRRDHQVKIRGFRIEPGEVENALNQHPDILESVVMVRGDANETRYLIAYVVPHPGAAPSIGELRTHLKKSVPEYMIPAQFLLMPQGLPLTANGKLDRKALPDPERSREGVTTLLATPTNPKEEVLARLWQEVLGLDQVGIHDNFFDLGGDSILSIQIVARARQAGLTLTLRQIFQHQTIAELAQVADQSLTVCAEQGTVTGPVPLTAIQCWFLAHNTNAPHHFNQAHLLTTPPEMQPQWVMEGIRHLIVWHDALRLRFIQETTPTHDNPVGWRQEIAPLDETLPFTVEDLSSLPDAQWATRIATRAEQMQASLDLTHGPLLRVVFFQGAKGRPGRLLIIIHHLAIDGVSWRILLEDLEQGYKQASQGEAITLPAKTTSLQQWARRITAKPASDELIKEIAYWQTELTKPATRLPLDWPADLSNNTVASTAMVRVSLDPEQTMALLHEAPSAYNTQINDLLLTAFARALTQYAPNHGTLLVDLEGHGREELYADLDISRTVGWFTALFPVHLDPGPGDGWPSQAIKRIKESLRAIPRHGIGYGLLRYIHRDLAFLTHDSAWADVSFNYFGQYDQRLGESHMFSLAKESIGSPMDPNTRRSHILEVNGFVTGGQMHWDWTYSTGLHKEETIKQLARDFLAALQQVIQHCLHPDAGGFTPADFPEADLNQDELDALLAELE
ncbi:MAG: amino acid adenylation domain-containing protein [Magnetococcus sp. YQC-5]